MQLNGRNRNLTFLLVRQAESRSARHLRMRQHSLLQLAGINRVAARLDHVFAAPHEPNKAQTASRCQVSCPNPSIFGQQTLAVALVFPIVGTQTTPTDLHLAHLAIPQFVPVVIDHANAERRNRKTEIPAPRHEGEIDAHHGQAAQLHHPIAV
jgi:hypothetical protein